jgi:hypothetical protein
MQTRLTPAVERTETAKSAVPAAHRHSRWPSQETLYRMNWPGGTVERPRNLRRLWYLLAMVIASSGWLLLKELG